MLPAGQVPADIRLLGENRDDREAVPVRRASNQKLELARAALTTLGFTKTEARVAVDAACAHGGTDDLEGLIKAALRHC